MSEQIKKAFEAGFAAGFNTGEGYDSRDADFDFAKAMAEAWEAHRPNLTAPPPQYAGNRPLPHRRNT